MHQKGSRDGILSDYTGKIQAPNIQQKQKLLGKGGQLYQLQALPDAFRVSPASQRKSKTPVITITARSCMFRVMLCYYFSTSHIALFLSSSSTRKPRSPNRFSMISAILRKLLAAPRVCVRRAIVSCARRPCSRTTKSSATSETGLRLRPKVVVAC